MKLPKLYALPIRKLINYFQEKQANYELGNTFVDRVKEGANLVRENLNTLNEKEQTENLAFFAALGGAYQKNPQDYKE